MGFSLSKTQTTLGFTTPIQWYTFGAKHGDSVCQFRVAEAHYGGTHGLKQDYALASQWLDKCLKQDQLPEAVQLLVKMQQRGVFVRPRE
jgi:TPR repeat protein